MKQKMLVTGGEGFIGTAVIDFLKNSEFLDLITWDRKTMGDLLDKESRVHTLKRLKPDIVLHLAWCAAVGHNSKFHGPHDAWSLATLQFIDECLHENIWFINAGSSVEDGPSDLINSPYARAKLQIRDFLLQKITKESITHLELQYVFSLEARRPSVIKFFIEDEDFEINRLQDPNKTHDFIEVKDVAAGIGKIIGHNISGTIYLGTGKLRSVEQLVYSANKSLNYYPFPEKKFEFCESAVQPNILTSIGWQPQYTISFFE